jgi:gamma-glutamylcyclotransferase (GGCT)/AIG2-like uncharacterized protein YtfP
MTVFVYETLLRGNGNHDYFLADAPCLGEARLTGYALYDLGSYPGIVPEPGGTVLGELYEVDAPTLARLNRLEDEGHLYALQTAVVALPDGSRADAGIYVYLHEVVGCPRVDVADQPWRQEKKCSYNS